ncbi:MAG: alanine racemase [Candidatus Paceibacterota bacterium]|jgi:alanine racemase
MKKKAMKTPVPTHRTWVEIDTRAIEGNARTLKVLLSGEVALMAVVKSNAYGHGMVVAAKAALKGGANWLAVDELNEALELRKAGIKASVLVLGYTLPAFYKVAAAKNVSLTISSLESLQNLAKTKLSKRLRIHIKFDTGLHRQGLLEPQIQQAVRTISAAGFPAVIEGAYTHFAAMETPTSEAYSRMQIGKFKAAVERLREKGFTPITHASASSGILFSDDFHCDMSRAGISLYGLWPSPEIRRHAKAIHLVSALSWKTIVTETKFVPRGSKVGYDLTYEVARDSRIAVIPVGYWHGLSRGVSNRGQVLIGGKRANIIGRVSMDMAIVDVTDMPGARESDEVVLIGTQGSETISADEMAEKAGTINYEVVTRINPLIPRIALK